jgi:predicted HAD superfamily Cof-like phosphohydrolase
VVNTEQLQVHSFQSKMNQELADQPTKLDGPKSRFYRRLIEEEAREVDDALASGSIEEIGGELVDLIYTCYAAANAHGLDLHEFWVMIHEANMRKIPNPNGGKPLKGPDWKKPDLKSALGL